MGRDPVHIRLRGRAEGRRALPIANILANAAQAAARIDFGRQDKVFNVLPMFPLVRAHSRVMLPLVSGVRHLTSIRRRCTTARLRSWSMA